VIARFRSRVAPDAPQMVKAIEEALAKPPKETADNAKE